MAYTQKGDGKSAIMNFLFYFMASLATGTGVICFMLLIALVGAAMAIHPLLAIPALIVFIAFCFAADKSFNIYRGSVES